MKLTPDQIVDEASQLPPEQLAELVERLTWRLHQAGEPELEEAWKAEVRRRLAEIECGQVQAIPGEEVSDKIRRIVGR